MHKEERFDPFIENNTGIYSNLLKLKQAQKHFNAISKSLNYRKEYDIFEHVTSTLLLHVHLPMKDCVICDYE